LRKDGAWAKQHSTERETQEVSCKVVEWLDTELDISSWKLVCMERKRCPASARCRQYSRYVALIILLRFVVIIVLFKVMVAGFLFLTSVDGSLNSAPAERTLLTVEMFRHFCDYIERRLRTDEHGSVRCRSCVFETLRCNLLSC